MIDLELSYWISEHEFILFALNFSGEVGLNRRLIKQNQFECVDQPQAFSKANP